MDSELINVRNNPVNKSGRLMRCYCMMMYGVVARKVHEIAEYQNSV
jgi:hypothetical protein